MGPPGRTLLAGSLAPLGWVPGRVLLAGSLGTLVELTLLRIKARVPRYARRTVKCIRYVLTPDILVLELAGTGRTDTATNPTHLSNRVLERN